MRLYSTKQTEQGFSLIELVIYIGLVSIMLLALTSFITLLLNSRGRNQAIAEVEQQGVAVLQLLTQTTRNASAIITPAAGSIDTALEIDTGSGQTVFSVIDDQLQLTEAGGDSIAITNDRILVSDFSVRNATRGTSPGIVTWQVTFEYAERSGKPGYSYSRTFYGSASLR